MAEKLNPYINKATCLEVFRGPVENRRFKGYLKLIHAPTFPHELAWKQAVPILAACINGFEEGKLDHDTIKAVFITARESYKKIVQSGHDDYHMSKYKQERNNPLAKVARKELPRYQAVRDLIEQEVIDGPLVNVSTTRLI